MKTRIRVVIAIVLIVQFSSAQNYQTVEEINDACSQLGFSGDEEAEIAVDRILDQIGLFRNFTIQECPNINNAVAKNIETSSGQKERYILYDANFFSRIDEKASSDWAAISILAHEIGHHLNGHALNNEGSNHKFELEADYFSGTSLAKMGATLNEAQSAIQTLRYEKATSTHPTKADRLKAIEKGWNKAKGITTTKTNEEENKERALDYYRKGEQAFQDYDFTEALSSFNKAKDLGNVDAYYFLSIMYYHSLGVIKDKNEAYRLAKTGYDLGSVPSTYQLGYYLYNGFGVLENKVLAKRLFKKNYQAKWFKDRFKTTQKPYYANVISDLYTFGYGGVDIDRSNGLLWLKHAAEKGDLVAQHQLGFKYRYGKDIEQDFTKATLWFREAAESGYAVAQFKLAFSYIKGEGVQKDSNQAKFWCRKSARQGYKPAQTVLTDLGETW